MNHIYVKSENGTVKVFGNDKQLPYAGMFYVRKQEGLSWGDFLTQQWNESLMELKWASKQDEIKVCFKLKNEHSPFDNLEDYLKDYREITSFVNTEEIDCKFPACTCSPSKCKEKGIKVSLKDNLEIQSELLKEVANMFIAALNGNGTFDEIIEKFEIKRK